MPPLIKGYLRLGARICGEPAWDPDFNTADFLMWLSLEQLKPRYARHFDLLAQQAGRSARRVSRRAPRPAALPRSFDAALQRLLDLPWRLAPF